MRSYEPLHPGDPFPADAGRVRRYGEKVRRTGELIEAQVALLRRVADGDRWRTETADAFREKATGLAASIERTRDRYRDVGSELVSFSDTLEDLESEARVLAVEAREEQATLRANPEAVATPEDDGSPGTLTNAERAQNRRRSSAQTRLGQLQRRFDRVVGDAAGAADESAARIKGHVDDDARDSWWDRNVGWLGTLREALGWIALAAGLLMLTVATGGTIWLVLLGVAVAASFISLIISVVNVRTGHGGWADVAFDAVALLTLGTGGLALRGLARGLPAARTAIAKVRAQQAFTAALRPGWRLDVLTRVASVRFNLLGIPRLAQQRLLARHVAAGDAAHAAYRAAMAEPAVSAVQRFALGGSDSARLVVGARRMAAEVTTDPQLRHLAQQAARLDATAIRAAVAVNVGTANQIVKLEWDRRVPGRAVDVTSLVVDAIVRLR